MFSSSNAGKSVDSLSALSPGGRHEVPLHSSRPIQSYARSASRRNSTASSIHSMGGTLDNASSTTTLSVYESGQNAISTLLQPPIVRTGLQPHTTAPSLSSHRIPTARDIPPVTLTNIPIVDAAEFNPYLTQIGALYEQLRRVKESEEETTRSKRSTKHDEQPDSGSDSLLRPTTRPQRRGSTSSIASLGSIEAPSPSRRSSSGLMRKAPQGPAPLSTIPTVYFDEDFHLENPRTFDIVSERSEVIRPPSSDNDSSSAPSAPRKALATNAILQEKLSWYMDTIEVHLINSISTASTTFFTALGSLKELHSEAAESVERITALREELQALDEEVATNGLLIAQKRRRQENLRQLNDAVIQLHHIVDGLASCESLVDAGELEKALSSIDSLDKLIAGEREGTDKSVSLGIELRSLRGSSALQGINQDLTTLRFKVGKAYESQWTSVLLADLRRHSESVSASDVLLRWSNAASRQRGGHSRSSSVFPTYLTSTEELKTQLMPNMVGLHRAKYVVNAAMAYRDTVLREIRNLVRRPLPSSSDDDNESMLSVSTASGSRHLSSQEKSTNLARNLRAMDPEDAEVLLVKIYVGVTETLRRLSTQVKVLLDIASSLSSPQTPDGVKSPPFRSPVSSPRPDRYSINPMAAAGVELQEELHKSLDINSLLTQAVDVANDKIVKILKVRTEQATHLPLDFFLRYFTLNLYFANECEAISGRSGTSLKNVVNGHIKEFVQRNRDAEMQKLAQGMEADQWNAKDFTEGDSQLLDLILGSSTQDAFVWTENNKIWIPYRDLEKRASTTEAAETNGAGKEKARSAVIESEKFLLPTSAILCLEGIGSFLHLIAGIPSMTTDVASSLTAYLQLFNSRCTQLILGAGATRSAGLKNITTKHLALASQALSFTATLVPHIREFVRSRAGSGPGVSSLMGEFDKVRRLLQDHQASIHQKLVDIMSGRAAIHAKSMKTIDWDSAKPGAVQPYMEILARETTTLHRVLTKHLPESSIQMIMAPVFASYKEQLGAPLREATPKTEAGQQNMLQDVEFFSSKLGKLEGFGDAGDFLADIAKSKYVKPVSPEPAEEVVTADNDEKDDKDEKAGEEGTLESEGEVKVDGKEGINRG
ncbi:hypothetical protein QQS21_008432 [Conoideocrella luteorostrata]|uniref:Vacuolar protein sorting-associated protein 54 C-terminal domain-containing protein n=1 Tax=Conoideocrella luteorostrata TaxID=1105319 RepID=A0AAJ0CIU7_9HYPO|nr:hypothetical protein QQS21_008432 [Conoideocrella luteorostrata]